MIKNAGIADHRTLSHFSRQGLLFILLSLFCFVTIEPVFSTSTLTFPRVSFDPKIITGLAIVNPTEEEADVQLTLYKSDGTKVTGQGLENPVTITVPAGQQFARTVRDLFGRVQADGPLWCRASSLSDDLTGFFLFLNTDISYFDGAEIPKGSTELFLNSIRLGVGYSTEVDIVNSQPAPAEVTLDLFKDDQLQSSTKSSSLSLPAFGSRRINIAEHFDVEPADNSFYMKLSSSRPVAAFSVVRSPDDLLGLSARPSSEKLKRLYFPQMTVLPPFVATVSLTNYGDEPALVSITARQPDGTPFGANRLKTNPVGRQLEPGESLREDLEEMFGFYGEEFAEGWLEVSSTSAGINGSLSYAVPSQGSLAAVSSEPIGLTQAVFSHIATTFGYFTGIAVLNPASLAANVRVVAIAADGSVLGSYSTTLRPGYRISKLINELIPEAANQAGGMIWVSSDIPVYLTSLFGNSASGVLANIPPQPVPAEFRPDAGAELLAVQPSLAIVTPGQGQQFIAENSPAPNSWNVNDIPGGSSLTGMVSATGRYTAPVSIPDDIPVTITAKAGGFTAGASVDVLSQDLLLSGLGLIQSVAYLSGLERLYIAELSVQGLGSNGPLQSMPAQAGDSTIFDVTQEPSVVVRQFPNEEITRIVPFQQGGEESLLLVARSSGSVLKLNPVSGEADVLASGLNSPTTLVVDPITGDLLVAEADGVTVIRAQELASESSTPRRGYRTQLPEGTIFEGSPTGLAVDACTEDVFISEGSTGRVVRFERSFSRLLDVAEDLANPGSLAVLYRKGVACPNATHLLVAEQGTAEIKLIEPSSGRVSRWADGIVAEDLAVVPDPSPGRVLIAAQTDEEGQLQEVDLHDTYEDIPASPKQPTVYGFTRLTLSGNIDATASGTSGRVDVSITLFHREDSNSDADNPVLTGTRMTECQAPFPELPSSVLEETLSLGECDFEPLWFEPDGNTIVAEWDIFPLGASCTLNFSLELATPEFDVCQTTSVLYRGVALIPGY